MAKSKSPAKVTLELSQLEQMIEKAVVGALEKQKETAAQTTTVAKAIETPLDKLELTNGKDKLEQIKSLEQTLAINRTNPFGTTEFAIFEEKMKTMTIADMQALATKIGVDPYLDSFRLKEALKTAFITSSKNSLGSLREIPKPKNTTLNPRDPKHLALMQSLGMRTS